MIQYIQPTADFSLVLLHDDTCRNFVFLIKFCATIFCWHRIEFLQVNSSQGPSVLYLVTIFISHFHYVPFFPFLPRTSFMFTIKQFVENYCYRTYVWCYWHTPIVFCCIYKYNSNPLSRNSYFFLNYGLLLLQSV